MASIHIQFHGVRGSLASPSAARSGVGGNTSCVEVQAGRTRLILDAGTGLRTVGNRLAQTGPSDTTILLSHLHWDHIQGLPFFTPLYQKGSTVRVISGPNGYMPLKRALEHQMAPPFFPVALADVGADVTTTDLAAVDRVEIGDAVVTTARLNHPDPVYGYRIECGGESVVYATDTEHYSCIDPNLARLAEGADVLIYDAQYLPEEYSGAIGPSKVGWGHSTYQAAAELAREAGVGKLVLFHHDPERTDAGVADIERRAKLLFRNTEAAREGQCVEVGSIATAA